MTSRKTLNAANLEALGAPRLAELLLEISGGDAAAKRHLRLALADAMGPSEIAREVRKRLTAIGKAKSFIDWRRKRVFIQDLDTQWDAIANKIAPTQPDVALDLMWRFLGLAGSVHGRCDDSDGDLGDLFHMARQSLGPIAEAAAVEPGELADQTCAALTDNGYGQYDGLIAILKPALGASGLAHLKERIIELSNSPVVRPPDAERQVVGYGPGPIYADEIAECSRRTTVRIALKDIADAQGDVDAYIAQHDEDTRRVPKIAADIAQRLIAAGRSVEALAALDAAQHRGGQMNWPTTDWADARIAALDALGRHSEAQAARWSVFEQTLSAPHLKTYLKQLGDDLDAEEQALDFALSYSDIQQALVFLLDWPDLDRAARLVIDRARELDGNWYGGLTPAAQKLASRSPLAATLILRAMIDFTLRESRATRYKHAVGHLEECGRLASMIADFGAFESHVDYAARIRQEHRRKTKFQHLLQSR